jgi:hypothetical protein
VKVDGAQVGGTFTASALHAAGQSDTLTLKGDWAAGPHRVEVAFLNDAWGGTAATDRNLYLDAATYNGKAVPGSALAFAQSGAQGFAFTEAAPVKAAVLAPEANFFAASSPWNTAIPAGKALSEIPGLDALADKGAVGLTSWDDSFASVSLWRATANDPLVLVRHMADTWSPVDTGGVKRVGNDAATEQALVAASDTINEFTQNPYSTE